MKTNLLSFVFFLGCFGLSTQGLLANNIQISTTPTVSVTNDSIRTISFNLTWDNSWKSGSPRNWDAAWVFCKFSIGGSIWDHVYLVDTAVDRNTNNWHKITTSYGATMGGPAGSNLVNSVITTGKSEVPGKGSVPVGVFIYRKDQGYGSVDYRGVNLKWNYKAQGYSSDDPISVKVFAIEMVYCAEGAFYLGDFGTSVNSFKIGGAASVVDPFFVTSEKAIKLANPAGVAVDTILSSTTNFTQLGDLPAEFPKGFRAFYIMKHEVTQEAYSDFLNTLGYQQQSLRQPLDLGVPGNVGKNLYPTSNYRNSIILFNVSGSAVFACNLVNDGIDADYVNKDNDGQNIAMNYMSVGDATAYLAWAGLRPLTELEYEKAARGPRSAAPGECAWGTSGAMACGDPFATATKKGEPNEKPDQGNCNFTGASPLRVGAFADSATTRIAAGAGYWGAMELSGNVAERYINVDYTAGRAFTGRHGYGVIGSVDALPPAELEWPTIANAAATNATAFIFKGGAYTMSSAANNALYIRLSDRSHTTNSTYVGNTYTGCRGGRTENATK